MTFNKDTIRYMTLLDYENLREAGIIPEVEVSGCGEIAWISGSILEALGLPKGYNATGRIRYYHDL